MDRDIEFDPLNMSVRKFLKQVGVTSQRAIEKTGEAHGRGKLKVRAVITAEGTDLHHVVEGEIEIGEPSQD